VKKAALFFIFFVALAIGSWPVAVPESLIVGYIEDFLDKRGLHASMEEFQKGFFYNIRAEKIILRKNTDDSDMALVMLEGVHAHLDLMSLVRLEPEVKFDCSISDGTVTGWLSLLKKDTLAIQGRDIGTNGIPVLDKMGIVGDGDLSFSVQLTHGDGEVRLAFEDLKIRPTVPGSVLLPTDKFDNIKGAFRVDSGVIEVKSLSLRGNGIFARAKGFIKDRTLDIEVELMVEPSFDQKTVVQKMLARYKVLPGYYKIPVRYSLKQFL
jgi:type II secretion system protein N